MTEEHNVHTLYKLNRRGNLEELTEQYNKEGTALSLPNRHYVTPVTNLTNTVYALSLSSF